MRRTILLMVLAAATGCGKWDSDVVAARVRLVNTWKDPDKFGGDWGSTVEVIESGNRFVIDGKFGEPGDEFTLRVYRRRTYKAAKNDE